MTMRKYTKQFCINIAKHFRTKNGLKRFNKDIYNNIVNNNWIDICFPHIKPQLSLKKYICHTKALEFNTRSTWAKGHPASYSVAWRNGWLDELTGHMK